jgi:hypothetical protein
MAESATQATDSQNFDQVIADLGAEELVEKLDDGYRLVVLGDDSFVLESPTEGTTVHIM